jgi:hypothetical protein
MVVRDLDVRRAFRRPNKAYPELVIDTDRVLTLAIARKRLKPVARRRPQVGRKALRTFAMEDGFCRLVPEAPDHNPYVS